MPENKKRKYLKYLPRFLRTEKLCNKDDLNKNATYCTVHLLDESVQEIQLKVMNNDNVRKLQYVLMSFCCSISIFLFLLRTFIFIPSQ